jgi:hypothetical protein
LETAADLVNDVDDEDVFVLLCEEVEQGELDDVLDEVIDPVEVFELVDDLLNRAEALIVELLFELVVLNGEDDEVFEVADVLVDALVLIDVIDTIPVCV